jgi:hypothetical protein
MMLYAILQRILRMKLTETCSIYTGYTARGRLEPAQSGGVPVIQLRDISGDGGVDAPQLTRIDLSGVLDRYFVRAGDVIFRSRGERNTASALDERFSEPAVAVLPIMILRPKLGVIIPQYLAWAINQPAAQRQLNTAACGSKMRMVPRSSLEHLDVDVPDLETQHKIVAVDALSEREQTLAILAAQKHKKLTSLILGGRASSSGFGAGQERNTN